MMDREGRQRKNDLNVPEKEISNHSYASSIPVSAQDRNKHFRAAKEASRI